VAIITALLVVMLAASIAAFLLAQQSHALTRTVRATERAQAMLFAPPTLDYARSLLSNLPKDQVDLSQPWVQGLRAIPVDGAVASGLLRDEAGLFNLNNLVNDDGKASEPDVQVFARLLTGLKLNPDLANAVTDWIDADDEPRAGGAENGTYFSMPAPYRSANQRMVFVDELIRVRGFDAATINRLRPFVTALPARTKVNFNSAPQEVLVALLPNVPADEIAALVRVRVTKPFVKIEGDGGLRSALGKTPETAMSMLDTNSRFMSASIALDYGGTQVRQSALLFRGSEKWPSIIWVKTD
jgi:general secretion pathway protein K